jgi:excisionase family DNA binding protein
MKITGEVIDNMNGISDIAGNINQHPKILTIQEVADLLRLHRSTVSRYAQAGTLKSYLIGNRRLFKESDVWSFFDNQVARIAPEKGV